MESTEHKETKKCPHCDESISIKAKRCPRCQEDLRSWFRRHPILTFLLILITSPFWGAFVFGLFSGVSGGKTSSNSSPQLSKKQELNAAVNFTGTEFVISNLDNYVCQNARMKVNDEYTLEGYNLESALDPANKSTGANVYKVGAGQFTKGDGTRLNPFAIKPKNFSISCRGSNELSSAFWYGEFK